MTILGRDDASSHVAAIIVSYNSADHLPGLLASLEASTVGVRVIVVDNGSADGSVAVAAADPRVIAVATGANLGYSGGINVGRRIVRDDEAVAILNPDLVVADDMLEHLLAATADPAVGIASPMLLDADGNRFNHLRREPGVLNTLGDSVFGNRWPGRPTALAETMRRDSEYDGTRDVAWAGGAAMVISSACNAAVGEWDHDTYFLYSEETDYARRARDLGYAVRYVPTARATHVGSGSGQPAELVALLSVNRVRYYARLHGRVRAALFRAALAVQHLLRPHDHRHRVALRHIVDRSSWDRLPAGDHISSVTADLVPFDSTAASTP
ncbi:glycosyl transferase family 2 [Xylanimonas cellulosilytica DSM 15894]|uniref:Glycosyl transferase family 2 n=1 Tax=Xylanimonas cellulosilytica (strain DSM 15894 / JCM 12276 / CECT 5975 / KCTC 9989 / LMG 20990 / NBRC 107835 / XIL07) TaxID=446471 RepID=D1BXR6_XYLCX|nr:glycosyltransferase family 2 protein [Xylanimonas cellulosilytica]ACZ31707.1 glycosyl transferase family 2 [Xylanimonas cellulosilytica DSM 15894]